ncbi:MAG: hypothetical protein HOB70_10345 [Chloroflexi bacterium]|nr:hypothetical protein [Chloroflexota bacterium]
MRFREYGGDDYTVDNKTILGIANANGDVHTISTATLAAALDFAFTEGSVIFADSDGDLDEDNTNLHWDATNYELTLGGDLLPKTTLTHSLGSETLQWKDLYVGPGSVYMNGTKILHDDTSTTTLKFTAKLGDKMQLKTTSTGSGGEMTLSAADAMYLEVPANGTAKTFQIENKSTGGTVVLKANNGNETVTVSDTGLAVTVGTVTVSSSADFVVGDVGIGSSETADGASLIGYNPTTSELTANNVADALDEIVSDMDDAYVPYTGADKTVNLNAKLLTNVSRLEVYDANDNTRVGWAAGASLTTGSDNTTIGDGAAAALTEGSNNTVLGSAALAASSVGTDNVAIGAGALQLSTGSWNSSVGKGALNSTTTGIMNVALGYQAAVFTQTGSGNVVIGYNAGMGSYGNSYSNNTLIGTSAGDSLTTGSSNILIGSTIDTPTATTSSHLNIGGTIYGDLSADRVGIGVVAPTASLHVPGSTAGAASTASLKLGTGTLLSSAEAGAIEYDGSYLYYTDSESTPIRHKLASDATFGDYVPYSGASGNVDLNEKTLTNVSSFSADATLNSGAITDTVVDITGVLQVGSGDDINDHTCATDVDGGKIVYVEDPAGIGEFYGCVKTEEDGASDVYTWLHLDIFGGGE